MIPLRLKSIPNSEYPVAPLQMPYIFTKQQVFIADQVDTTEIATRIFDN